MPDFQRSIPVAKALDSATLLAFEMNGDTLPIEHGFPLRVVAPGWAGDSWIKWVTSITVLNKAHDGFWMARAYRHPGRPVAPGTIVPPEKMQPVTSLRVKSVISDPIDGAAVIDRRRTVIRGVAWGGDAGPDHVGRREHRRRPVVVGGDVAPQPANRVRLAAMGIRVDAPTVRGPLRSCHARRMPPATGSHSSKSGIPPATYGTSFRESR
jgi:hypothetical protein